MIFMLLPAKTGLAEEEVIIKIGYDRNSRFIMERDGKFYGYGVEYLNKIAQYTGWTYEYVNVENWQESFDKLRNGEIHFICTAHYTEDRAAEFVYSDLPFGYEVTLLYTNNNSDIYYKDYGSFQNRKVGLLLGSYSSEDFSDYAEKNQLEYEPVYFRSESEMRLALENNEIDLLAIGSRYGSSDLKLVDRLGVNAFYCISNQEYAQLIEEVETAIQEIMFDDPTFEGKLNEKYFSHELLSNTPMYTKEELAFINSLDTIKVKMLMDQQPSWYEKDGEVQGIGAEYMKLISEKSGIKFQLEAGKYGEAAEDVYEYLLIQDYLLLRIEEAVNYNNTEGIIMSSPLMDIEISYIERQDAFIDDEFEERIIALSAELSYVEQMLNENYPNCQIVYYIDAIDCLEAVIDGSASLAVIQNLRAGYLMQKPEYADKLIQVSGEANNTQVRLVAREDQEMLINVINKAVSHISQDEKDDIVARELLVHPYHLEFSDIWYKSKLWVISIASVIIISFTVYYVLNRRMTRLKIEKTEYEILQKKLQRDELTKLYTRTYFFKLVRKALDDAKEEMCIVMMDICYFKMINELYGISEGDKVLKEVAEQLKDLSEKYNMIASRFMADHFYICVSRRNFEKNIFPKHFQTSLEKMDIRVKYGVYNIIPGEDLQVNVMCDRALTAAHENQEGNANNIQYYNDTNYKRMLREQEIEQEMEKALENNEFYIVVQPKFDQKTEKIVGGETLVRWNHPTKGAISPGAFVPVFERTGFIIQLDYFIWEETCRLISKRKREGKFYVPISVNVSRAHFYGTELINKLNALIVKYELAAKDLEIEITESLCGGGSDAILDKMNELRDHGYKLAMDDFGSGYSSLNMLKEMPVDIIKMDLGFLRGEEKRGRLILKSLIEMMRVLELKVVVEGVEDKSQVEFLSQFDDCSGQGFYFSRPIEAAEFEAMLEQ